MEEHCNVDNLICFKVYSASRAIIKLYNLKLKELDLTYPQYLVLIILYRNKNITVNKIGEKLHLDSGTLTPLLKRMEKNNLVIRKRSLKDERNVNIFLTEKALIIEDKIKKLTNTLQNKCKIMDNNNYKIVNFFLDSVVYKISNWGKNEKV